jgi:transcriptional regulator with XRE-family HTH domain
MNQSFGSRLRTQREQQRVSLLTISANLKIKLSLLEQLENDRVAHWPKGIFGRAYLRDYARSIGMDPESVVREFLMLYPDTTEDPFSPKDGEAAQEGAEGREPRAKFRRLVTAAISAVPTFLQRSELATTQPTALPPSDPQPSARPKSVPHPDVPLPEMPQRAAASAESVPAPSPAPKRAAVRKAPPSPQPRRNQRRGRDRRELSLSAAADLCSRLARALDGRDVTALLADAAKLLDAVGVVVWLWDSRVTALRASVAHGYSDAVLASLPAVRADEANPIATAFRSGETCLVDGAHGATGAVVIPSLGPAGCVGVLALEVRHGGEQSETVRAFATILAAQLGALLPTPPAAEALGA